MASGNMHHHSLIHTQGIILQCSSNTEKGQVWWSHLYPTLMAWVLTADWRPKKKPTPACLLNDSTNMQRLLLSEHRSVFTGDLVGANSPTQTHATLDESELQARNHEAVWQFMTWEPSEWNIWDRTERSRLLATESTTTSQTSRLCCVETACSSERNEGVHSALRLWLWCRYHYSYGVE